MGDALSTRRSYPNVAGQPTRIGDVGRNRFDVTVLRVRDPE